MVKVFRYVALYYMLVLSSPGLPPKPITLASLRRGKYRSCSRNPVLAQCLSCFHRIEERGSGFLRMLEHMLNHGLDKPVLGTEMGYFQVMFPGPGDDIERLHVPETGIIVTPAMEAQLNERQKEIVQLLLQGEALTSRFCAERYNITRDTVARDYKILLKLGLAKKEGKGRSVQYVWAGKS